MGAYPTDPAPLGPTKKPGPGRVGRRARYVLRVVEFSLFCKS
jgi:hypothetical protein